MDGFNTTRVLVLAGISLVVAACGGGSGSSEAPPRQPPPPAQQTFSIGGVVSGLAGTGLQLQDSGGNDISVAADGTFAFPGGTPDGGSYNVSILSQPTDPWQTCVIADGAGTVNGANVTNVAVSCATNSYALRVAAFGVDGAGLTLQNNGADALRIGADGDYEFSGPVESGATFKVTVLTEPTNPDQACRLQRADGVIRDADATVAVNCAALSVFDVAAGGWVSCALPDKGSAKCWGHNNFGNLGLGDSIARGDDIGDMGNDLPYPDIAASGEIVQIAPGSHSCAVLDDGRIKCWGRNDNGQLGLGDTANRGADPGNLGAALAAVPLGSGLTAVTVATGSSHSCALLDNGAIKCWGSNFNGQLGLGDSADRGDQSGEMGDSLPSVGLTTVNPTPVQIAAGGDHSCAVMSDGAAYCWGLNAFGQLGVGDTENRGDDAGETATNLPPVRLGAQMTAAAIAAGVSHTCALSESGFIKCWGNNRFGQLGQGDIEDRGDEPGELAGNLPVVSLGSVNVGAVQITAGTNHSCARFENGGVKCWGANDRGQLGLGDVEHRGDEPGEMGFDLPFVDLGAERTAVNIAAGATHTCASLDDGSVKCWGQNHFGQLGQERVDAIGDASGELGDALPPIDIGSN